MANADPTTAAAPTAPLRTPLTLPASSAELIERVALTAEQQTKYDWLLTRAHGWTEASLPPTKNNGASAAKPTSTSTADQPAIEAATQALPDAERMWLTRECLIRYLRATRWNQEEAERRVLGTVAWRRDYGVAPDATLTPDLISPENETGKQILLGYDMARRPCQYLNPGRQNTDPSPRQVQHLVYMVERVIDLMPAGVETLSLLINFKTSKGRGNTAPGIGLAREVLNILQTHYPERLGRALIINGEYARLLSAQEKERERERKRERERLELLCENVMLTFAISAVPGLGLL